MSALDVHVLVTGSGFGGSVAALRLTEKGYRVAVLEAGRRFEPEEAGGATRSWSRSGRGAPQGAFRENSGAAATDRALELVRNPCPLHDDVGADGLVPVWEPEDAKWTRHCYSM